MNAPSTPEMLALAKVDQKRLERLAALAGRTPRSMLKFVLRDGFEVVEREVLETLAAERDVLTYGAVPHADVVRSTAKIIEAARGRRSGKTA
jgi:hypothetical protein